MPNFDSRLEAAVIREGELDGVGALARADIVVALGAENAAAVESAVNHMAPTALLCQDCGASVEALSFVDSFAIARADDMLGRLRRRVAPWSREASAERMAATARELMGRYSSEDFLFAVFFVLHRFVVDLPVVRSDINPSWEKGALTNALEFAKMVRCCGPQIFKTLTDPVSKRAVDLLNSVNLRDQVGSYRVIVSFETDKLEDFTLCILQQNNCFNCDASILERPRVPLLREWRGRPVDAEAARQIWIGQLDHPAAHPEAARKPWSWRVVCGANPAYDAFPAQHQIFYPSETAPAALWYDPVFKVETVDGRQIWTKRHYRCTPRQVAEDLRLADGSSHGAWTLTTLDNGILSKEFWTTVDAADDLSWIVLHYSGAAARAGQSYQGALLCSADGEWPSGCHEGEGFARIERAFRICGLELWELYGHGPPGKPGGKSFMWTPEHAAWAEENPPPLDLIGDINVQTWRQRQREKAAAANTH